MATKRVSYIPVVATVGDLPDATAYAVGQGVWVLDDSGTAVVYTTDGATWTAWSSGAGTGTGDISLDDSATVTAGNFTLFVDSSTITDAGVAPADFMQAGDEADVLASTGAEDSYVLTSDGAAASVWQAPTQVATESAAFTLSAIHANKTVRVTDSAVITVPTGMYTGFMTTIANVSDSATVTFSLAASVTASPSVLPTLDNSTNDLTFAVLQHVGGNVWDIYSEAPEPVVLAFALSDETTALTTGTGVVGFHVPFDLTVSDIKFTVTTAPTGAALQFDVNVDAATVLSTKATIDATEKTTATAAIPAVISDSSWAENSFVTVDIDQIGSTIAGAGAKIWVYGYR